MVLRFLFVPILMIYMILMVIMIMFASWFAMDPVQQDRYLSLVGQSDTRNASTTEGRIRGMAREFELGMERPIVGHGLGTTPEAKYHRYGRSQASHNLYAQLIIEVGLIGMVLFLRFLWQIYRNLATLRRHFKARKGEDSFVYRLTQALTTVFFMYAVYSMNYWGLSQYYWYLLGGLVFAFERLVNMQVQLDKYNEQVLRQMKQSQL